VIAAIRWDPITMDLKEPNVENKNSQEPMNPFQKNSLLAESPKDKPQGTPQGTPSQSDKPPKKSKTSLAELMKEDDKGEMSSLEYATKLLNDLSAFVATKNNIHSDVKVLIVRIQKAMLDVNKEWKVHTESARKKVAQLEVMVTPLARPKRMRPSPESLQTPSTVKKRRNTVKPLKQTEDDKWEVVEKKKKTKPKPAKKPQPREARKVRPKTDALVIGAKDPKSYAEILRKVKLDPNLKELGSQVARIRRTKNGEMLFELKGDSLVKSVAYKGLMEQSLKGEATVRALTQEVVVECRNIDEITTEEELREQLIEQFSLGEIGRAAQIKLRKAYGGTQIATIKLPVAEANLLLEKGKIRVGWTICQLQVPRTQLLRCYRCLGFGHVAVRCTSTDRSNFCWRCGESGHVGRTCKNKPKCMLCQDVEGNDHATGSLRCNAYKEAKAHQGWR
jgi:hypothetical protein